LREVYGNLPIRNAFAQADNVLTTAAKGIAEIITVPGYVNVDFQDVKTVMSGSGSAVMGSAVTEGENRARRAAEEALASPLLNEKDILGAQKVLLSIISGEQAELQMDELSEITDYISEMAGEEAEVIFGHGIDPDLGESIRVTVIATGFDHHSETIRIKKSTVIHLESGETVKKPDGQIDIFETGETVKESKQIQQDLFGEKRKYIFENPTESSDKKDEFSKHSVGLDDDLLDKIGEEQDKEFTVKESINNNLDSKKIALQQQSRDRVEKLKGLKEVNHDREGDFREKWSTPAYIRRNVNLQDIPHSSEKNVSKYNLNDDNQLLGNNTFLHDNVD
jgi:cell division protein FtsZ